MLWIHGYVLHFGSTYTFCEAIEECLAQNHMAGLFEVDPQHIKVYVSKSVDSAGMFCKPENPDTSNEPIFSINHRETIEATLI